MATVQTRRPAGTAAGGQFSSRSRPEPQTAIAALAAGTGVEEDGFDASPGMAVCPDCGGAGEVQHPMYGARNCPDPTITCRTCHGRCEIPAFAAAEIEYERQREEQMRLRAPARPATAPTCGFQPDDDDPF